MDQDKLEVGEEGWRLVAEATRSDDAREAAAREGHAISSQGGASRFCCQDVEEEVANA